MPNDLTISGGNCSIDVRCSRWSVSNYTFTIESWLTKSQVIDLRNSIRPGAVGELYKILDKPFHTDTSWTGCYSYDTDILTENGWISFPHLVNNKLQVRVATLNPKTDMVEYHYPIKYIKYEYKGKMFHQSGLSIDFLVTPNHRVWCRKHPRNKDRKDKGYEFVAPNNIPKTVQYRRDFPYFKGINPTQFYTIKEYSNTWLSGKDYNLKQTYRKNERKIKMTTWLKFLGWYLSEGYNGGRYITIGQSKSHNPNYCDEIEDIIIDMGYKVNYKSIAYYIHDVQLANELSIFGKDKDRFVPKELKRLPKEYLILLLDSLIKGDGHFKKSMAFHSFSNSSRKLIDDVAEIAIKCGYVVTIGKKGNDGTQTITFSSDRYNSRANDNKNDRRHWIDYNNWVYCVEVPNHIIYTRRNGRSCWNGNSNTLQFIPIAGTHLSEQKGTTVGYVRNITTRTVGPGDSGFIEIKLECFISSNSSI